MRRRGTACVPCHRDPSICPLKKNGRGAPISNCVKCGGTQDSKALWPRSRRVRARPAESTGRRSAGGSDTHGSRPPHAGSIASCWSRTHLFNSIAGLSTRKARDEIVEVERLSHLDLAAVVVEIDRPPQRRGWRSFAEHGCVVRGRHCGTRNPIVRERHLGEHQELGERASPNTTSTSESG